MLEVRNPVHHTRYRVLLPEYPGEGGEICSCPDFARRGIGTCKHVEAASAWLTARRDLARPSFRARGAGSLWKALDRARIAAARSERPPAVRLREPGRLLFDRPRGKARTGNKEREGGKGSADARVGA